MNDWIKVGLGFAGGVTATILFNHFNIKQKGLDKYNQAKNYTISKKNQAKNYYEAQKEKAKKYKELLKARGVTNKRINEMMENEPELVIRLAQMDADAFDNWVKK